MNLNVKREKGTVKVPVYMRDYTAEEEYSYVVNYRGFVAYLIKHGANSWWAVKDAKWVAVGKPTKKAAEDTIVEFVDDYYEVLCEKGIIETEATQ